MNKANSPANTTRVNNMIPINTGVENGIQWATCRAPMYGGLNGYARIPDGHPWHDLGYSEIEPFLAWDNELTYAKGGWIGFDTMHGGDIWPGKNDAWADEYSTRWTPELVVDKARELARHIADAAVSS